MLDFMLANLIDLGVTSRLQSTWGTLIHFSYELTYGTFKDHPTEGGVFEEFPVTKMGRPKIGLPSNPLKGP